MNKFSTLIFMGTFSGKIDSIDLKNTGAFRVSTWRWIVDLASFQIFEQIQNHYMKYLYCWQQQNRIFWIYLKPTFNARILNYILIASATTFFSKGRREGPSREGWPGGWPKLICFVLIFFLHYLGFNLEIVFCRQHFPFR